METNADSSGAKGRKYNARSKGMVIGKEAICRILPISSRTLCRMVAEKSNHPIMKVLRFNPITNQLWAFERELVAARDRYFPPVNTRAS